MMPPCHTGFVGIRVFDMTRGRRPEERQGEGPVVRLQPDSKGRMEMREVRQ